MDTSMDKFCKYIYECKQQRIPEWILAKITEAESIAETKDAGCRPYMMPERIDPERAKAYDVWSYV
ncbi:dual specificity mitogen-activated protein kinase kinase 4-like [Rhagoletis pomonella]|uniref:dual specificity mitogen-activated protein kinase kinase 4-like n=1 Tax=Rhagoletis pomonella TaxID=28610 RepID=UPI00177CFB09|nr:dual specificity mitogen-activated protein kinase kinase 4-like [Rhagoletis pomonella]